MRRFGSIALAMIAIGAAWAGVTGAAPQDAPTFRAGTDLVSVGVSVRERGRAVSGLVAKDFTVRDNGVPQTVLDVSYEKLPIDVTVALDVSQSVTGVILDQMRRAVGQLKSDLRADDRLKLLSFNMRVTRLLDFTAGGNEADRALAKVTASGSTSLFDALAVALVTPTPIDRRQLVVMFSDGIDSGSITDAATIVDVARQSSSTLAFVLPMQSLPMASAAAANRGLYTELASETGGVVVQVLPRDDLAPTFRRVLEEFRSSYVLHFTPQGVARGGLHTLEVKVGRAGVEVRARKGYGSR